MRLSTFCGLHRDVRNSFGSNQEKKINCFEDLLIENVFWRFVRFVSTKFSLFRLFQYWFETPNKPKKMFFGFAKQTKKQPKQIEFRFVSVRTKKNLSLFRGHPTYEPQRPIKNTGTVRNLKVLRHMSPLRSVQSGRPNLVRRHSFIFNLLDILKKYVLSRFTLRSFEYLKTLKPASESSTKYFFNLIWTHVTLFVI